MRKCKEPRITGNARDELKTRIWRQYQNTVQRRKDRFAYAIAARIVMKDAKVERKEVGGRTAVSTTVVSECPVEQGEYTPTSTDDSCK